MAKKRKFKWARAVALASGAGITLLGMILGGLYLGHLADVHLNMAPWGSLAGSLLGGLLGLWSLIRQMVGK